MVDVKFHENHCLGVQLMNDRTVAHWIPEYGRFGWVFSSIPIKVDSKVSIEVMNSSAICDSLPADSKMAFFDFTSTDPANLTLHQRNGISRFPQDRNNSKIAISLVKGHKYSFWISYEDRKMNAISHEGDVKGIETPFSPVLSYEDLWFQMKTQGNIYIKFTDIEEEE